MSSYATGRAPQGLASADVNGDGRPDLLVASSGTHALNVLLNQTAQPGTFAATPLSFPTRGTYPVAVAVSDLNADSLVDVVLVNETSGTVSVLLHTASAALFAPAATYTVVGRLPRGLALGDVNADGLPDIIVAVTGSQQVSVLLNTPTAPGTFQKVRSFPSGGQRPEGLALGDLNRDGLLDIVVGNQASGTVGVLLNTAQKPGKFAAAATYPTGGASPRGLALRDVTADSLVDVLVANADAGTVSVLGNATATPGTLLPTVVYASAAPGPVGLSVGDVNGDQAPDVVVADYAAKVGTAVCLLTHSSTETGFKPATALYSSGGTAPHDVLLCDVDGDGWLDIATTNFGSNTVGVLVNTGKQ